MVDWFRAIDDDVDQETVTDQSLHDDYHNHDGVNDDDDGDQETVTRDDCSTVKRELSLISWIGGSDAGVGLK